MLLQHAGLVSHFKAHWPIFQQYGFFFLPSDPPIVLHRNLQRAAHVSLKVEGSRCRVQETMKAYAEHMQKRKFF